MRKESNFLGNMGLAVGFSSPEPNDSVLVVPPLVLSVVDPIQPTFRMEGAGAISDGSKNVAVSVIRNNAVAANNTLITFSKGYYEINLSLTGRFNWTALGTTPILDVYILSPLGSANPLLSMYAFIGVQQATRTIKILFVEDGYFLRLAYGAVGVAENLEAVVDVQLSKFF